MLRQAFFHLFAFVSMTNAAMASNHDGAAQINWWGIGSQYREAPAMGWYLITFIIFVAAVIYAVRKPLRLYLETRSRDIRTAILEAKIAKEEADKRLKEYEARLLRLDDEIVRMKKDFAHQGEVEKAELRKAAEQMALQIAKDTEEVIAAELRHALNSVKKEVALEVIALSGGEIAGRVQEQMNLDMRNAFARDIGYIKH